jgi:hypothetical protein
MRLTPDQEAAYALDFGVSRADLKPTVQAEYDLLLAGRTAAAAPRRATAPAPVGRQTWQGSPLRPRWRTDWSLWLLIAVPVGVVLAFLIGAFGGPNPHDATNLAAAAIFLFSAAALCVAVPGVLYRRYRVKKAARPPGSPFAPCYRCGYPFPVHVGADLRCPEAGICYRCGQPFTSHVGYELACSASPTSATRVADSGAHRQGRDDLGLG